jgi:hypothetical protein
LTGALGQGPGRRMSSDGALCPPHTSLDPMPEQDHAPACHTFGCLMVDACFNSRQILRYSEHHASVPFIPAAASSVSRVQSRTWPFQSEIRPSRILTTTTLTSSPSTYHLVPPSPSTVSSSRATPLPDPHRPPCIKDPDCASSSEGPNVLLATCCVLYHFSSSEPEGTSSATPLMVALILLSEAVFIPRSSSAREPARAPGRGGDGERPGWLSVGGRWEIQSCTRRETREFDSRLSVLREEAGVVMITIGELE